jgi:hypothetical protein
MIEKGNAAVLVIDAQLCAFDGVRFEACHQNYKWTHTFSLSP